MKRKLTTIFCADVQNYGVMMAADETGTMERLTRYRSIMDELFARHGGRKVNTWGDSVIGEFESVVEAVRCAVEIQSAIRSENEAQRPDKKMWFRIGINLGDVMDDNGDIYGDGVNVAARLESMAEPGGILVSESVYDFSHKQLAIGFDFIGEQAAKSGDDPVPSYKVRLSGSNRPPDEPVSFSSHSTESGHYPEDANKVDQALHWLMAKYQVFKQWFPRQNRKVKFSVTMIGFFFLINLLFSGIATPWFIFPSLPFLLMIVLQNNKSSGKET